MKYSVLLVNARNVETNYMHHLKCQPCEKCGTKRSKMVDLLLRLALSCNPSFKGESQSRESERTSHSHSARTYC